MDRQKENQPDQPPSPPPVSRKSKLSRFLRAAELTFAATGFVALLLVATPVTNWLFDALDRQTPLARSKYIICLGGDSARIIESARLLSEGYGDYLIVSNHEPFSRYMRELAIEWGADPKRVLVDDQSRKTRHHAASIARNLNVNPAEDTCIIVTSFTHMARSKACFEKAGYRHLILREPRWERSSRKAARNWKWRFKVLPEVIYEYAALAEYFIRGDI